MIETTDEFADAYCLLTDKYVSLVEKYLELHERHLDALNTIQVNGWSHSGEGS